MKENENKSYTAFDEIILKTREARAKAAGIKNVEEIFEKPKAREEAKPDFQSKDFEDEGMDM